MTHFAVLVLIPQGEDVQFGVTRRLAPYDENGEWFAEGSRWDWWTIGGRFTGLLDGYDPEKDPLNTEVCDLCDGTGTRTKPVPGKPEWVPTPGQCNGCRSKGQRIKWATAWAQHAGDILPMAQVNLDLMPFPPSAVVTVDGAWHEEARVGWWGTRGPNESGDEPKEEGEWKREVADLLAQPRHPQRNGRRGGLPRMR